jgi:hypothetical protein
MSVQGRTRSPSVAPGSPCRSTSCSRAHGPNCRPMRPRCCSTSCAGLGRNASGNGDLSAAPAVLQPKMDKRRHSRRRFAGVGAVGLIVITRRGNRRKCNLYAVTLWPMDCDFTKLDHGPGAYSTSDWQRATPRGAEKPTKDAPAVWRPLRENENSSPAKRQPSPDEYPPRDKTATKGTPSVPAAGAMAPKLRQRLSRLRDTFLDLPSGASTNPKGARTRSHETSVPSSGAANAPGQRRALAATQRVPNSPQGRLANAYQEKPHRAVGWPSHSPSD